MKVLRRPSFYFFTVPFLGIALGSLLHDAMGCGYECTGPISGPLDRAAMFIAYLFGYGLPLFVGLAILVLVLEIVYFYLVGKPQSAAAEPPGSLTTGKRDDNS